MYFTYINRNQSYVRRYHHIKSTYMNGGVGYLFHEGREDLNDEARPGRARILITNENVEKLKKIPSKDRRIFFKEVADDVDLSFCSCETMLMDILLNFDKENHRITITHESIERRQ